MRRLQAGLLGLTAAVMMTILPSGAYAYTEAEKRKAKAWLSSHGYPATEAGAYQAYDDWMNGKWWDEFGPPEGMGEDDDDDETKATAATQKDRDEDKKSESQRGETKKPGENSNSGESSEDPDKILKAMEESSQLESVGSEETRTPAQSSSAEEISTADLSLEDESSTTPILSADASEEVSPVTQKAEEGANVDLQEEKENHLPLIFGAMIAIALLLLALRKRKH